MSGTGKRWPGRTAEIERPPIAEVNALAAELEGQGRDLINLGQAILGLAPPQRAIEKVRQWMEVEQHVYSPDPGLEEVRGVVARFLEERKGIRGGDVVMTCGANQAFMNALLTVTRPGDEVILFVPGYFDHGFGVKLAGCVVREVELVRDGRYTIDFGALERAIGERTRCVVLVSPGNPSGMVLGREETERLVGLCRDRGLWLISDETYDLLTFPPVVHVSPASVALRQAQGRGTEGPSTGSGSPLDRLGDTGGSGERGRSYEKVVVLGSFSKVFALASWRVGYYWGPGEMIEESIKVQDALVVCAPVPSQLAAVGAIESVDEYVPAAVEALVERRDALLEGLEGWPEVEANVPEGGTFVLARLGVEDDVEFCKELLRRTGVITVPGSGFGAPGCVRISFGNQEVGRIREACGRMRQLSG